MVKETDMGWKEDLQVVMERDPAPKTRLEAALYSPGFHALIAHRIAHRHYQRGNFTLARGISYWARVLTGCDIHPGATIGEGFFIDHAIGVVIGETAIIGDNVSIYQGVTLGGVSSVGKRHPTIGDCVTIGTGATVLGNIKIGDHVKVGAGSVVVKDVPPHSTVVGIPGKVVKREGIDIKIDLRHDDLPDPLRDTLAELTDNIHRLEHRLSELESELKKHK